jgi:hypothetical protein
MHDRVRGHTQYLAGCGQPLQQQVVALAASISPAGEASALA